MAKQTCPTCRKEYDTLQALNTHRAALHGYRANGKRKQPTKKRFDVVLTEVYSDTKRILLVDEAGDWWVARKLDV